MTEKAGGDRETGGDKETGGDRDRRGQEETERQEETETGEGRRRQKAAHKSAVCDPSHKIHQDQGKGITVNGQHRLFMTS